MSLSKSKIAIQVEKEHECIKRDMGILEKEVMKEITAENFSEWRMEYMWRLRDFRLHLMKHFDLEEEGGFMSEVLANAPQSVTKVKELEHEHENIVEALDVLLNMLKHMETKNDIKIQEVRKLVYDLLAIIRKHEAAENDLIQLAYFQDYGYPA